MIRLAQPLHHNLFSEFYDTALSGNKLFQAHKPKISLASPVALGLLQIVQIDGSNSESNEELDQPSPIFPTPVVDDKLTLIQNK